MKKIVTCILAVLYLGLTTGLAVNIHYCMGKITAVAFQSYDNTPCACGDESDMPCCMHDYHLVKVSDEHQSIAGQESIKAPECVISPVLHPVTIVTLSEKLPGIPEHNPPPDYTPQDLCIQHCIFRI